MRRTLFSLVAAFFACGPSFAADADAPKPAARPSFDSLFGDEVIAQGKGVKVTSSQLEDAYVAFKANLAGRGERINEADRLTREAQLLDRLIVTQILTNRATAADATNALPLEQRFLNESRKGTSDDAAFNVQLRAMSLTPEQFRQRVHNQALSEAVIDRELKSTLPVPDADVQDFFQTGTDYRVKALLAELDRFAASPASKPAEIADFRQRIDSLRKANLSRLEQPERVRILHIFFATRARSAESELPPEQKKHKRDELEKLRARALAGEDFAGLVLKFSEDRGVAETKGEYTFSRNDPFAPEFKSAAFSLEPGKISDIVSTPFGYHVVKLLDKIPAQRIEFDKAAKDLREVLQQQSLQKALPEYFSRLKQEAAVEILNPKYRLPSARPPSEP